MITERLDALRSEMKKEGINMYIVPTSDFHDSEYVGDYFRAREFLSGFTGSAGILVVSMDEACLWTDGRYFLQADYQLEGTGIKLMKMGEEGVPTISEYIKDNIKADEVLGFDGRVLAVAAGNAYSDAAKSSGASTKYLKDLADVVWTNRPSLSENKVYIHDTKYSGLSAGEKLENVRKAMKENDCNCHVLTSLDDIAWLLNLRGSDVECNPVFLSYIIINEEKALLFAQNNAFDDDVKDYLKSLNIELKPYNNIYDYSKENLKNLNILIDNNKLNYSLYKILSDSNNVVTKENPSTLMKAVKNDTEIACLHEANIKDGVAMVKFLYWLDSNIGKIDMTELSVSAKLEGFRAEQKDFMGISFDTIAGYNEHGAIIHYEPTKETDIELKPEGLLLVDSGAQYLQGTTDITRTIALGPVTEEMKHHYTMVLRSHLRLAAAKFVEGCCGANLDILARGPFWNENVDYNHGTGHGVGFFLNVHEGPQSFHWRVGNKRANTPFKAGMVITDEPGIYIEGKYGIRIENDILCCKGEKTSYGQFMNFESLTLAPIDMRPVNFDEMNKDEIEALDKYHELVRTTLTPYLNKEEADWLTVVTTRK